MPNQASSHEYNGHQLFTFCRLFFQVLSLIHVKPHGCLTYTYPCSERETHKLLDDNK